jgi:hypothetical protein
MIGLRDRWLMVCLLALWMVVVTGELWASPAGAAAANCATGSFGQRYEGVGRNPSGARASGSQATIEVRESALCSPPSGKLAQAAAFAGLFQAGGGGFAWVGWDRLTGGQRYGVYHYSPDGALEYRVTLGSVSLGESFKYKATWKNGTGEDGTIHFIVCAADGSNCTDFGSTPFQGNTWSDIEGRIVGNTNTKDADIRGIKTNKNDFTAIMWRDGKGPWQTTTSYDISSGVSRYHHTVVSNSAIRTWTDPL